MPLAEYEALLDAAHSAPLTPDLLRQIVAGLRASLDADEPDIPVEDVLADYDAAHDAD